VTQLELGRQGVQAQVIDVYELVGCSVARVAQSYRRGTRRNPGTPGIPDLYVFPPLGKAEFRATEVGHAALILAPWWHETKSSTGKQRLEQRAWELACLTRGVAYVLGGVREALDHLRKLGLVV
jgi:hypothetical protein